MDEATSSLDEETEAQIMNEIHALKGTKTFIIISHRPSTLSGCDRILEVKMDNLSTHKFMKVCAIILARGGSKGLKDKNIIEMAGKPLIQYTIDVALESKSVNRTIVSTDSQKIAELAISLGADSPF